MRAAILKAALAAGAASILGVEILSLLGLVRQLPLLLLTTTAIVAFAVVLRARPGVGPVWVRPAHPVLLGCLLGIGGITLLVALISPPNSWDSMTYHMARIAQWYAHGNVEPYLTPIDRQLWQPPFGEYLVLLGYGALGARDYLANLPQWLAGTGAVLVVMEIAKLLGATSQSRYLTGMFAATAPAVILQSSSTLTDLLGGFWLACAAWLALSQYLAPRFAARDALWFSLALALAIGTKGTSIPLGIPWLVVFLLPSIRPLKPGAALPQLGAIVLVVLLMNGGQFLRNLAVFGSPLGPESVQRMLRPASMEVPSLLSNLVAHVSLQIGTPWAGVNGMVSQAVTWIHSALGVDLAALYPYFGGFRIFGWTFSEDIAGNLVHTGLGMIAVVLLAVSWRRITSPERVMAAGFLSGALLFVVAVRWQPFIARLHTPMILLACPCLLLLLVRRWPRATRMGAVAALLFAIPPLLMNTTRPIIPATKLGWTGIRPRSILIESREAQYFATRPALHAPYRSAVDAIDRLGCRRVALVAGFDSWEYPLWALGRDRQRSFAHVDPAGGSPAVSRNRADVPCAVVGLDRPPGWRPPLVPAESLPLLSAGPVTVWR